MSQSINSKEENSSDSGKKNKPDNGPYPKVVFLIVFTELCERFSYYGLRTVLYIYFSEFLGLSSTQSTVNYHAFSMLCFFSPIIGKKNLIF